MMFLLAFLCLNAAGVFGATESELRRDLFADYDKLVRPIRDVSKGITLLSGIQPLAINYLSNNVLSLETFTFLKWHDDYLTWDPKDYSNITALRIPNSEVWKPDLSVYTTTQEEGLFPKADTQVLLYPDGTVLWVPYFTIRSRCPLPQRGREKDYVTCNIKFGSWTYDGPHLDLQLYKEKVDLTDFQNINPEWKLVDVQCDRQEKYYPCCPEPYPSLNFNVTLKRRADLFTTEAYPDIKMHLG